MAMKERTGRSRISKAEEAAEKIETREVIQKTASKKSGRSKISKANEVVKKIETTSGSSAPVPARVRPASKADEIEKKIPSGPSAPVPTRVRPASKVDKIEEKIPSTPRPAAQRPVRPAPQQPGSRVIPQTPVSKPTVQKNSGCCLLPFTLAVLGIIGALVVIF